MDFCMQEFSQFYFSEWSAQQQFLSQRILYQINQLISNIKASLINILNLKQDYQTSQQKYLWFGILNRQYNYQDKMIDITSAEKKAKYRPEPVRVSQDTLIIFQLTQQNMLSSWGKKLNIKEAQTNMTELSNDDDLVYSDNERDDNQQNSFQQKQKSKNNYGLQPIQHKQRRILSDRINIGSQLGNINLIAINGQKYLQKLDLASPNTCRNRTQGQGQSVKENFSFQFGQNKSVFFRKVSSGKTTLQINFRTKRRANIHQLVQKIHETQRKMSKYQ